MIENLLDVLQLSHDALLRARDARGSTESERATLIAEAQVEAQVTAIQAVAVAIGSLDLQGTRAIDRLTKGVEHIASALEHLQWPAGPPMPRQ